HISRDDIISQFCSGLDELKSVFGNISPLRLGVRYVNIIDKNKISEELGYNLDWNSLVSEEFIKLPHEIANIANTNYMTEVRSNLSEGELALRYGLVQNQGTTPDHFRFDLDRYAELSASPDNISETLQAFTQDIYLLFNTVVGDKLKEWMTLEKAKGESNDCIVSNNPFNA
ncbi:MAG: TIGR04255 family protein, partial [Pseudomonadales bacterium]